MTLIDFFASHVEKVYSAAYLMRITIWEEKKFDVRRHIRKVVVVCILQDSHPLISCLESNEIPHYQLSIVAAHSMI
jgi:hypothetical protein